MLGRYLREERDVGKNSHSGVSVVKESLAHDRH